MDMSYIPCMFSTLTSSCHHCLLGCWRGLSLFLGVLSIVPKIPEILVRKGKERSILFFFQLEYLGSPLEMVHLFWSEYSDRNLPFHFLTNWFINCPTSLHLCREFGKGIKNGKTHSSWLARFDWKMLFHFPRIFPLVSDQLVWHNGKHPCSPKFPLVLL